MGGGFGSNKYYFFHKIVRKRSQKWPKFCKKYLTKKLFNYLLFGRFSKQLVEEWNRHLTDFLLRNTLKKSPKRPKKQIILGETDGEKKTKTIYIFCSTLVVGCTKVRFTLLYKRIFDLPVFCLTPKCPPKIAGNCLTKNYLFNFLGGLVRRKYYFSTKSSENGPKNGSNFAKSISRKDYLIICFLAVS